MNIFKKIIPLVIWIAAITILVSFIVMRQNGLLINQPQSRHMVGKDISSLDIIKPYWTKLSTYSKQAKIVLLSTRCESCEDWAQNYKNTHKNDDILIGVFYRANDKEIKEWVKSHDVPFQLVIPDPDGTALVDMGARFLPTVFTINEDGVITSMEE